MRVTLTGCRFIGSRDGLGDSRGRLHLWGSELVPGDTMLKLIHSDSLEYRELVNVRAEHAIHAGHWC